jgi:hypothetical protein
MFVAVVFPLHLRWEQRPQRFAAPDIEMLDV